MRRGEVYWFNFKAPDKKRPVVILTRSALIGHLNSVTVAAISTTLRNVASEVPLDSRDGMPKACAVNLHNVFTVQQSALGAQLATLSFDVMNEVDSALEFALGVGEQPLR